MRINITAAPCLPVPAKMHIDERVSSSFIGNFMFNKQRPLSKMNPLNAPERNSIEIHPLEFETLIGDIANSGRGLRIYIACDLNGFLTVVFVPTKKGITDFDDDKGNYTTIDLVTGRISKLSDKAAKILKNKFYNPTAPEGTKWQTLTDLLGKHETKSVVYSNELISGLKDEFDCLKKNQIIVDYITLHFGAYNVGEILDYVGSTGTAEQYNIGGQIALFFSLGHLDGTSISFNKNEADVQKGNSLFYDEHNEYDSGIPCPPTRGCDGSDL